MRVQPGQSAEEQGQPRRGPGRGDAPDVRSGGQKLGRQQTDQRQFQAKRSPSGGSQQQLPTATPGRSADDVPEAAQAFQFAPHTFFIHPEDTGGATSATLTARNRGHIVNLGSTAGTYPYKGGNVYGGTKAFVKQFSLNLRTDLLGTAVRVTNIEPGLCESEFSLVRFKGDRARADKVYEGTCPIVPEDIAETVRWVTHLPAHVNINSLELMPVCQASGPLSVVKS